MPKKGPKYDYIWCVWVTNHDDEEESSSLHHFWKKADAIYCANRLMCEYLEKHLWTASDESRLTFDSKLTLILTGKYEDDESTYRLFRYLKALDEDELAELYMESVYDVDTHDLQVRRMRVK